IDVIWTDIPDPRAPMGAHGVGEIGITGVGAAVANAIYNATGKRIRDLPITLEKLLRRPPWGPGMDPPQACGLFAIVRSRCAAHPSRLALGLGVGTAPAGARLHAGDAEADLVLSGPTSIGRPAPPRRARAGPAAAPQSRRPGR